MEEGGELLVWPGDWGLPTIDCTCLSVLAYSKFLEVDLTVVKTGNTWRSPTGEFPILKVDGKTHSGENDILQALDVILMSQGARGLGRTQDREAAAYSTMIKEKIMPAIHYGWWVDVKNQDQLVRPWYAKTLPFPLGLYVPGKMQRRAESDLNAFYNSKQEFELTEPQVENMVYKDAKQCINFLSHKLQDKKYFGGERPSYLDAVIFSSLATLYCCPLPNNILQQHIKQCPNLCRYCDQILLEYFPPSAQDEEVKRKKVRDEKKEHRRDTDRKSNSDPEYPHKTRNKILGGLVAFAAMVTFAIFNGLLEIEYNSYTTGTLPAAPHSQLLDDGDDDTD